MSILYPNGINYDEDSFHKNRSTLECIKALGLRELMVIEETDILKYLTANIHVIRHRQEMFEDIYQIPDLYKLQKKLIKYIEDLKDIAQKRVQYSTGAEDILYSFGEVRVFTDMILAITAEGKEIFPKMNSVGFKELFESLIEISKDENFNNILKVIEQINESVKYAHSVTLGLNLNHKFEVYEAGVVSINQDYYSSNDIFTKVFGITRNDKNFRCFMPLVETKGNSISTFEQTIYNVLNNYIYRSSIKLRSILLNYIQSTVSTVYSMYDDIKFILNCYDFISELKGKRCPLCIPEITERRFEISGMVQPQLAKKMSIDIITANSIEFDQDTSIFILTGPNNGGKSAYVKAIGICCILMQLGLYIPATFAKMKIMNSLYCHFPVQDSKTESRLADECLRMKEILDILDCDSFIFMDESFSSTNSLEGGAIAIEVIKNIHAIGSKCIFSTHFHELARNIKDMNIKKPRIGTLCAEYKNGQRTYSIVEKNPEGYSFAYEIAKEYGLEYNE